MFYTFFAHAFGTPKRVQKIRRFSRLLKALSVRKVTIWLSILGIFSLFLSVKNLHTLNMHAQK